MSESTEAAAPKSAEPNRGDPPGRNFGWLVGRYRWVICGLLFFATTINYIDRQVFSLLGPELQKKFHWTDKNYTDIVFWFEVAYAIGLLGAGRLLDRIGTRLGLRSQPHRELHGALHNCQLRLPDFPSGNSSPRTETRASEHQNLIY